MRKKKAMKTKKLIILQALENLVVISGLSAILFTGLVLIGREFSIFSNLLTF
jgi:hypothetical protein